MKNETTAGPSEAYILDIASRTHGLSLGWESVPRGTRVGRYTHDRQWKTAIRGAIRRGYIERRVRVAILPAMDPRFSPYKEDHVPRRVCLRTYHLTPAGRKAWLNAR